MQVIYFTDKQHCFLLHAELIVFKRFYKIPHFLILFHFVFIIDYALLY